MGIYKQNKKAQRKQKIKEGLQVFAAVAIFYILIGIIGHYEYIDYCILHNIRF
jgi:hypothetical protein